MIYLENHKRDLPSENKIGIGKRNEINAVLTSSSKAHRNINPLASNIGPQGVVRSLRMDRIEDMHQVVDQDKGSPTYGQPRNGFHFDYFKVNNNMMPDVGGNGGDIPERNPVFSSGKIPQNDYNKSIRNEQQYPIQSGSSAGFPNPETPTSLPRIASAADLLSGGGRIAIPTQSALGNVTSQRPREYALKSHFSEIDHQESALMDWAKKSNRFIPNDEASKFEAELGNKNDGGSEHNTWFIESPEGKVIIRRTIKDSYGFAHRSPFQYLQRMADVSREVPRAPISFLGMSQNARGNGVIRTSQPFIKGDHPEKGKLIKDLGKQGWSEIKTEHPHLVFKHKPTGIMMHDVHPGNFISTPEGEQVPIDVFFEGIK